MSDEKEKLSLDNILKKIQKGDNTLLIVGAIIMLIPMIALFFLAGGKTDIKSSKQQLKSMTKRKNVFNFAKKEDGKQSALRSDLPSKSSNWFGGSRTIEQQVNDELRDAMKVIEQGMKNIKAPEYMTGDMKESYEAEHNYYLCMGNGALENRNYAEAEKYFQQALEDARGNIFLEAYTYGSLCALYETTGDRKKLEEAYKKYFAAVGKLPPEFGGGDLNSMARNAYMALKSLKDADLSKVSAELANNPMVKSGAIPANVDLNKVYLDFPVKYDE